MIHRTVFFRRPDFCVQAATLWRIVRSLFQSYSCQRQLGEFLERHLQGWKLVVQFLSDFTNG